VAVFQGKVQGLQGRYITALPTHRVNGHGVFCIVIFFFGVWFYLDGCVYGFTFFVGYFGFGMARNLGFQAKKNLSRRDFLDLGPFYLRFFNRIRV